MPYAISPVRHLVRDCFKQNDLFRYTKPRYILVASATLMTYDTILLLPQDVQIIWPGVWGALSVFLRTLFRKLCSPLLHWTNRRGLARVPDTGNAILQKPFDIGADVVRNSRRSGCESVQSHGHDRDFPVMQTISPSSTILLHSHASEDEDEGKLKYVRSMTPGVDSVHPLSNGHGTSFLPTYCTRWQSWKNKWSWRIFADVTYLIQKYGSCLLVWAYISRKS